MRRSRVDETQSEIVAALRKVGVRVWFIGQPCDLLCRFRERYYLLDVEGITEYRRRDPMQLTKFSEWGVILVDDVHTALSAVGAI